MPETINSRICLVIDKDHFETLIDGKTMVISNILEQARVGDIVFCYFHSQRIELEVLGVNGSRITVKLNAQANNSYKM